MTEDILQQGVELTILGMGTVFVFLAVLILATRLMSRLVLKFDNHPVQEATANTGTSGDPANLDQAQVVAIIAAAVRKYRKSIEK